MSLVTFLLPIFFASFALVILKEFVKYTCVTIITWAHVLVVCFCQQLWTEFEKNFQEMHTMAQRRDNFILLVISVIVCISKFLNDLLIIALISSNLGGGH